MIRKYALAGGASTASTTRTILTIYPNQGATLLSFMKTGVLGLVIPHTEESNAAVIGTVDELFAVTAP